ncbi:cell division protein ZapE [Sulfuriferula nivalis]|uniref:Cell division protein ZapE n=1 Tax=Sulfuriferula nivalis TaxID=2675298 RepID=A0A809RFK5_9PROT|nr:cell division protein ZapE [Sulfuriferula nivalis]BBO99653.1 cell division protein ZapE [Sulfuriferula nivalis]
MVHEVMVCIQQQASARGLVLDASQQIAVAELQRLHDDLLQSTPLRHLLRSMFKPHPMRGVYLWGGVGRGKSFIMDAFFACVPLKQKQRMHFHHFMHDIHNRLAAMKGQPDPLARLSREFSQSMRLLCLDEFHISDIADAMLMRGLLQGLLDHGVAVVVTSNTEPDALYRNGLQRSQFVPCIDLIKAQMAVLQLDGGADYRRNALEQAGVYHTPLNATAEQALDAIFHAQAGNMGQRDISLQVDGRTIVASYQGDGVAGFTFAELCGGPRSKADYIELAARFHTLLLSGVPQFGEHTQAEARRFLWLVDELYDRRVKLILSAAVPLAQLAPSGLFDGEFERALSRLAEMQSHEYLMQSHRANF